jgi:DNA-binding MarR family transcriptional regulator
LINVSFYLFDAANIQIVAQTTKLFCNILSEAGYIDVEKAFKGKRPCTICRITPKGQQAFEAYVKALKSYLKIAKK